jgi:non-specific serine/threonine protein kinase
VNLELILTPAGHLLLREAAAEIAGDLDRWTKKVVKAFASSEEAGFFALAATKPETPLSPSLAFWRDLGCRYLDGRCRTPRGADFEPLDLPPTSEWADTLAGAPPMQGGEYLNAFLLERAWRNLDAWVREEVAGSGDDLSRWLKKNAPMWHQVGRVCFHLAENARDPDYPFAFLATYAPRLSSAGRVQYQPLSKALEEHAGNRNKKALIELLSPVHLASQTSAVVKELVDSGDLFHPLAWTPDDAYRFLQEVPLLEESGVLVRLPDWWRKRPKPRVNVTIGDKKKSRFGADTMLDFNVELALGDQKLTEREWRELLAAEDGLVRLKGQWVEVDREQIAEALDHWKRVEAEAGDGISFVEGMRLLAGATADLGVESGSGDGTRSWSQVSAGRGLSKILTDLRDPAHLAAAKPGRALRGTLRPYQESGLNWLLLLTRLGLGACLADDMGLGKTIQVISLLLVSNKQAGSPRKPSLLVLPASLLANWKAELGRFAPSLTTRFVHPSETEAAELAAMAEDPGRSFANTDLVLTTYGMVLRKQWLQEVAWRLVVLDEAQAIKNAGARQTRAVKKLKGDARVALTGTPVENRLSDLWSLFDFLCPGLLGSAARFKQFTKALAQRDHDRYAPLRNLVAPYILRRLKTDKSVIADLPDKTEMKVFCGLAKNQAVLYRRSVRELASALVQTGGTKRRGLVLAYLMRFKQICNHPSNFLGDDQYAPADSGKFERLGSICEEIASRQEKVLVFTQFKEMTEPLAAFLADVFGREGLILHGGVAVKKRKAMIDTFQREDGPPYFVLSLRAGGTGLNLTEGSHVIHFDRWWNPAVENQATDRAFRIGQKRNVLVHKFICRGTVEEKIDDLIEEKTALAGDLLEGGATAVLTEMGDEELIQLVSLDVDRSTI